MVEFYSGLSRRWFRALCEPNDRSDFSACLCIFPVAPFGKLGRQTIFSGTLRSASRLAAWSLSSCSLATTPSRRATKGTTRSPWTGIGCPQLQPRAPPGVRTSLLPPPSETCCSRPAPYLFFTAVEPEVARGVVVPQIARVTQPSRMPLHHEIFRRGARSASDPYYRGLQTSHLTKRARATVIAALQQHRPRSRLF
jgi:hypothetical protein